MISHKYVGNKEVVLTDYAMDYVKQQGYIVVKPKNYRTLLSLSIIIAILLLFTGVSAFEYDDCSIYGNCEPLNMLRGGGSTFSGNVSGTGLINEMCYFVNTTSVSSTHGANWTGTTININSLNNKAVLFSLQGDIVADNSFTYDAGNLLLTTENIDTKRVGINKRETQAQLHIQDEGFVSGTGTATDDCFGTLTGTGTSFTSQLLPGQLIHFIDYDIYSIVIRVDSDTSAMIYPSLCVEDNSFEYKLNGAFINQTSLSLYGNNINNDVPTLVWLTPSEQLGDTTTGHIGIMASSGGSNYRMITLIDRDAGSPYIYMENQDSSGNRVGANIIGLRTDGRAFWQTENAIRIEGFGGGLSQIDLRKIGFSSSASYPGSIDMGLFVKSSSQLEVNNGTSGIYRDLILRNLNATNITANLYKNSSGASGITSRFTLVCDVDLVALTKKYQNFTYTGGILTGNTTCS